MSFTSYLFFSLNVLQLCLFIYSISIIIKGLTPIYFSSLSVTVKYRYIILLIAGFLLISGIFITKRFKPSIYSYLIFPYLKNEIHNILYTWSETIFGNICSKIIDWLSSSSYNRFLYFSIHFLIFYLIRLFGLILFFSFIFLNGDLRLLIWITPLFLLRWLLSFLDDYLATFITGTSNYIRMLVDVKENTPGKKLSGVIITTSDNLTFSLTSKARDLNYNDIDLSHLSDVWLKMANLTVSFSKYNKYARKLSFILVSFQLFMWVFISFSYFNEEKASSFWVSFLRTSKHKNNNFYQRSYATEAYFIKRSHQKQTEQVTDGSYRSGHPVAVDKDIRNPDAPNEVRYEGQPTHGTGSKDNPSYPLHPSTDLQGKSRPQNIVPPKGPTHVPESWLENPIQRSKAYFQDPDTKANMAKHSTPQEEHT